jgi:16S rRNA (guanine527-N7)-methyltransferase
LGTYADLLLDWNQRLNLTAARDEEALVDRHLLDGLVAVQALDPGPRSLVDVGSGGGLPGIILGLARPDVRVTLVESIKKKAAFLSTAVRELGLAAEVWPDRAEQLFPRTFDHAIARAALPPTDWLRLGSRLVAPGGQLLVLVARDPALPPPTHFAALDSVTYLLPAEVPRAIHRYRRST